MIIQMLHPCRILNIPLCYDKPFSFFYRDVWQEFGLKESKKFPFFENGPHQLYSLLIIWLAFLHLILEPIMNLKSKKLNLRPLLLVFNSFQFTINFIGFIIISCFVTDFGVELWNCSFRVEDRHKQLLLTLGFIFMLSKIFELLRPALMILRGFTPHKIDTFGQVIFIILIYKGFLFFPFGIFNWMLFVDTLYHTFVYLYLIFSCSSTKLMKPIKYKNYLPILNMIKFALLFAHSCWTFSNDCPGYYFLKLVSVTYTLSGFILATIYMIDFIDKEKEKKQLKKDN